MALTPPIPSWARPKPKPRTPRISDAIERDRMAAHPTGPGPTPEQIFTFVAASRRPPAAPAAPPAPRPPANPIDSSYTSGVGRLMFQNKTGRDKIDTQGRQDREDFDTQLRRMAEARSRDMAAQTHNANREGLFYSGQLGKRHGEVEREYGQREEDQRVDLERREAARAQALAELGEVLADPISPLGYRGTGAAAFDLSDLYQEAILRALQRDQGLVV